MPRHKVRLVPAERAVPRGCDGSWHVHVGLPSSSPCPCSEGGGGATLEGVMGKAGVAVVSTEIPPGSAGTVVGGGRSVCLYDTRAHAFTLSNLLLPDHGAFHHGKAVEPWAPHPVPHPVPVPESWQQEGGHGGAHAGTSLVGCSLSSSSSARTVTGRFVLFSTK